MNPKNEKLNRIYAAKTVRIAVSAVIIAAAGGALLLAGNSQSFIDSVYRPVSRFVLSALAHATGWFPFSGAEVLLYLLVLGALAALARLVWVLIRGPRRGAWVLRFLAWVLLIASLAFTLFYGLWGLNYRSKTLAAQLGYDVHPRHYTELGELNRYIVSQANRYAELVERDANGDMPEPDFAELARRVANEFSLSTVRREAPAKYVIASVPLSHLRITGIFIPYTGEANVNRNNIAADLPFNMAHEMAHRYAVAREDEANFYSFFVLWDSDDPQLAYSAYLAAIRYCQNSLFAENYDLFAEIYGEYSELVIHDLAAYSAHWKQYEGKISEVSQAVNNAYLVVQGQSDGIKSYGRMTDLMLAWYEAVIK